MNLVFPRQGEIYLIQALKIIGDTKKRPAVVVSIDIRNQALSDRTGVSVSTIENWSSAAKKGEVISPRGKNAQVYAAWEWRSGLWYPTQD